MKVVLQAIRKSDESVLDEYDVTGYSKARVERYIKQWEKTANSEFYLKLVEDKQEHNGF